MSTCIYIYTYLHICMYIQLYLFTYIYIHMYIFIFVRLDMCICFQLFSHRYILFQFFFGTVSSSRGMFPGGESWKQTLPAPQIIRGRTELWTISSSQCLASKILGFHPAYRAVARTMGDSITNLQVKGIAILCFSGWWFGTFFSIYWEGSSQLTFIFFRGVGQPPTSYVFPRCFSPHYLRKASGVCVFQKLLSSGAHGARIYAVAP